ncbi:beta-propeller fold lactonase family protein [Rhizobium sp. X9]|uniref:lactonase family protein n=1 Tax=Rhizobium sp. X9 TaxID=2815360 RepID=UPI001C0AD3A6|nr:beta-propeller fold lactonase family protein [Rhizobium sp. X9]
MTEIIIKRRTLLAAAGAGLIAADQFLSSDVLAQEGTAMNSTASKTIAFVGTYGDEHGKGGGIAAFEAAADGKSFNFLEHVEKPGEAGYLVYSPKFKALYSVDERKTDGRGPKGPAAGVHAFSVASGTGKLTALNSVVTPGPFPTYLSILEKDARLFSANHGSFEHVEHIKQMDDGSWGVEYLYDDSSVIMYGIEADGRLQGIADLAFVKGHGLDPNTSPQAGGHGQASAHAHSAVVDPSGRWLLVGDKGTDEIHVFEIGDKLKLANSFKMAEQTGPRHIVFAPSNDRFYATLEFASGIASFSFDKETGTIGLIDKKSSVADDFKAGNEPADLRLHPNGKVVYLNNRGEDSLAWYAVAEDGKLARKGHVKLAKSIHPGLAARSFSFDPSGAYILLADRPANAVLAFAADPETGDLTKIGEAKVASPAFVAFAAV